MVPHTLTLAVSLYFCSLDRFHNRMMHMLDMGLTPFSFWICLQVRNTAARWPHHMLAPSHA